MSIGDICESRRKGVVGGRRGEGPRSAEGGIARVFLSRGSMWVWVWVRSLVLGSRASGTVGGDGRLSWVVWTEGRGEEVVKGRMGVALYM